MAVFAQLAFVCQRDMAARPYYVHFKFNLKPRSHLHSAFYERSRCNSIHFNFILSKKEPSTINNNNFSGNIRIKGK